MRWMAWTVLVFLPAGCSRNEEPPAPPASVHVPPTSSTPSSDERALKARSRVPGSCVVELPLTAPPAAAPAEQCPPDPGADSLTLTKGVVAFPEAPASPSLEVELAQSPEEKARGLMFRTALDEQQGMLFSWSEEEIRRFWMRNTCLPLDMLFISADLVVVGIVEQVPTLNDASRSVPCPAAHVLEVNAGWCRRHGVRPGQKIHIDPPPSEKRDRQ